MITAKEAKQLYEDSGAEVEAYLADKFDNQIRKAAKDGKTSYFHHITAVNTRDPSSAGQLEIKVMARLRELGYSVVWYRDPDTYVPRGLADDDGTGPLYSNVGLMVTWK